MSSVIRDGDTFHGLSVFGRGVFTNEDEDGRYTYAGQIRDGYACGLGVTTWPSGTKEYVEYGPDGQCDGRCLDRKAHGRTDYFLFERGEEKESASVFADGRCVYNFEFCAPNDPGLLALIAQVAPVEVRPATPATHPPIDPHSPPSNRPMDRPARFAPRRRWRPSRPPRCNPIPHAVAGGCATKPNSSRTAKHKPRSDAGAFLAGLCSFGCPVRFGRPRKPWPTCHCAWRCACAAANQVWRGTLGVLIHSKGRPEYSQRTPGVLTHSTAIPPRDHTQ
jgi:hypothetical protein